MQIDPCRLPEEGTHRFCGLRDRSEERAKGAINAKDSDLPSAERSLLKRETEQMYRLSVVYSWAATESPKNSQCKPVNNCGGSHDFPETLVSSLK